MARRSIGRAPAELDLLLSPSRGLQGDEGDEASLRNPEVQGRFRKHIADKLSRWSEAHPTSVGLEARSRRLQELGIILLDFRKLREGITSIRRVDAFACEVYEASVLLSVYAANDPQLSSSLPHLVQALHPVTIPSTTATADAVIAPPSLDAALSQLSLSAQPRRDTLAYLISLYLLHAHILPAFTSIPTPGTPSAASPSHVPLSTFLPTLFSLLRAAALPLPTALYPSTIHPDPHITHLLRLYHALLRLSGPTLARLFSASHIPPVPVHIAALARTLHLPASFHPTATLLRTAAPRVREVLWPAVRRAYRFPPDPVGWVARGLLFECEVEGEEREAEERAVREGAARGFTRPGGVKASWEDDEVEDAAAGPPAAPTVKAEAQSRAEAWVQARMGVAG